MRISTIYYTIGGYSACNRHGQFTVSLSPIYTMNNRCDMLCDKLCDRGNPCRKLSQAVATAHCICDSTHCVMGRDMHCDMGNPGRKLGVDLSCVFSTSCTGLRQNSINRPSLSHVATTCRGSHVAPIFS